jgi:hypothetical protein
MWTKIEWNDQKAKKNLKNAIGYLDNSLGSPDTMNKYRIFNYETFCFTILTGILRIRIHRIRMQH